MTTTSIEQSIEIIDTLILAELTKENQLKQENPSLKGDSAILFHLKKLKELVMQINEDIRKGVH